MCTFTSNVNFLLSSAGLPLFAGYSQSRSRPSKLLSRRKLAANKAKSFLLTSVSTITVNGSEPMFQPPIASKVFKSGSLFFRSLNLSNLNQMKMNVL